MLPEGSPVTSSLPGFTASAQAKATPLRSHPLAEGYPPEWAQGWGEDRWGPFVEVWLEPTPLRFRWVPPGVFWMGSPDDDPEAFATERPRHPVELTWGLWLGETPVTQEQWKSVMGMNPSRHPGARRPVDTVSFDDCVRFLRAVNELLPGLDLRLPTEAEWERACRAGGTDSRYGPLAEVAWYASNSGNRTHGVKKRRPNDLGLFDMLGNVWEWCDESPRTYSSARVTDPRGPDRASRVLRGGCWNSVAGFVRAAFHRGGRRGVRDFGIGFRLARGHALQPGAVVAPAEQADDPGE